MIFLQIDILSYLLYFGASIGLLALFSIIYLVITPYDEMALIRQGQGAACISLAGILIGFSLTLAASAIYHADIITFIIWAVVAMLVQLLGYFIIIKIIGNVHQHILHNNIAVGGLIGLTGLVLGIINAGCLS